MLKRGILTAMPVIEGRDFYPLLAEVGKAVSIQKYRSGDDLGLLRIITSNTLQ
jgi:hypothetical protein